MKITHETYIYNNKLEYSLTKKMKNNIKDMARSTQSKFSHRFIWMAFLACFQYHFSDDIITTAHIFIYFMGFISTTLKPWEVLPEDIAIFTPCAAGVSRTQASHSTGPTLHYVVAEDHLI